MISIYTPKKNQKGLAWSEEWRRKRDEVAKRTAARRIYDMQIEAHGLSAEAQSQAIEDYALRQISKSCY